MTSNIKVRFAPSPTGHLHIGGVRTALFNYLYARNQGGQFFLRMEDTDRERSEQVYADEIISSMKWLGLEWDGDVEHQTSRVKRYQEVASKLMAEGKAYRVDDATQAVKYKMVKESVVFHDVIKGAIQFDASLFDDLVIIKSDGIPTYNFACVVDDHDMEITHVIRGEDHISNTPRQIAVFKALGWQPPKYAHLPLIMGSDGTPLSKRHGAVSLKAFEEEGYLPEGILNYLALLGWGPGGNQEFFTKDELVKKFSLKRVNTTAATFDIDKMRFINACHLKKVSKEEYLQRGAAFFGNSSEEFKRILLLFRERIKTWNDLAREANYCLEEKVTFDPAAVGKYLSDPETLKRLKIVLVALENTADFTAKNLESVVRDSAAKLAIDAAGLIHPIRVAITGFSVSPGLFDLMEVLGRARVLARLGSVIQNFGKLQSS
ncbi:MAG: glutamate--tRNA ligase [Candidatus Omnitrophica bacterium]|nr:glutamate--tRNA ligase [Candidatus Omnitrophota bacterium]